MEFYKPTDWLSTGCVLAAVGALAVIGGNLALGGTHIETTSVITLGVILPILVVFSVAWMFDQ
ncbi:hypothetical protein [Natrinema soli]|uniref:Uncharacterized protein n=1 Tax=Natrinema soli TaxID=1930624 RepID=A0ABD5SKR4_9EURY|nr:hypothetical protein [Natrinema soli]